MENQSLLEECADWVAAQLEEENIFIDPALVTLVMDLERRLGPPKSASPASKRKRAHGAEPGARRAPLLCASATIITIVVAVLHQPVLVWFLQAMPSPYGAGCAGSSRTRRPPVHCAAAIVGAHGVRPRACAACRGAPDLCALCLPPAAYERTAAGSWIRVADSVVAAVSSAKPLGQ